MKTKPLVLSIAGSDCSGGAGIQADLKAITCTGSFAASAITAITAQNTTGVQAVLPVNKTMVHQQIASIFDDMPVAAVKIGMLFNRDIIMTVAACLQQYQPAWIVLDPVMYAKGGQALLQIDALNALLEHILPLAHIITPNLPEAEKISGQPLNSLDDMSHCAQALHQQYGCAVLLKGGHLAGQDSTDILYSDDEIISLSAPRLASQNTHGTGCTLSAAIASFLAQGQSLANAVDLAKRYLHQAIKAAQTWQLGQGHGPVDHLVEIKP